ncbi:hypothetical protein B7463_g10096, partial [Scytalidium lignicola]
MLCSILFHSEIPSYEGAHHPDSQERAGAAGTGDKIDRAAVWPRMTAGFPYPRRIFDTHLEFDILHPNRANISKDELRGKLAEMYKASKEQVNVFGLQTQFGGGKTTGFALVYDSPEALKKFEPQYRLIRIGLATKVERASRQQRKQRKNRQKTLRGTAKVKGAKKKKE